MIKICHITTKHAAFDTRIFQKECKALKSYYEVILLAANAQEGLIDGIKVLGFKYELNNNLQNLIRIFKLARQQQASVYHIHDPELLPLLWILKKMGKNVVYDVHEDYRSSMLEHNQPAMYRNIFNYFDNWAARNAALILAESSYISIYQGKAKHLCVVENFCDINALKPFLVQDRSECRNIVYVGTIHRNRGALLMVELIYLLQKKGLRLSLDLVGKITDPGLMATIEALPYYQQIRNQLNWHGPLPQSDSYRIAQKSFVGLCMLMPTPNHSESYPTKLFEYMAVGLPIIATNISLYKAVVERRECGICVPFEEPEQLADAVQKIYEDKVLQSQYSANGPGAVAMNYNWEREKNILIDFYRKL